MVIFQYNLYIFVWIEHGCLTNTVYAMDPNTSVIKRLWCISVTEKKTYGHIVPSSGIRIPRTYMYCPFDITRKNVFCLAFYFK